MSKFFIIGYTYAPILCDILCSIGIEYFEFPHDVSGEIES